MWQEKGFMDRVDLFRMVEQRFKGIICLSSFRVRVGCDCEDLLKR